LGNERAVFSLGLLFLNGEASGDLLEKMTFPSQKNDDK